MSFPKLPTVGGFKVSVVPTGETDDQFDGTAKTNTKRERNIENTMTRPDERNLDPRALKKEQDEKNLQAARKLKMGQEGAEEVKTIANQQAQMIRQALEKQLKRTDKE